VANIVAIVGRPNVGKSTFFNRLVEKNQAIMDNTSGVTRDRHYGEAEWCGTRFNVIDTGGYVVGSDDVFEREIRKQVEIAIEEADVVIFLTDCISGLTELDREFAAVLRKCKKPLYVAANKADTPDKFNLSNEFYEMGLPAEIFPVSAQSGSGTGELLDQIITHFPEKENVNPYAGLPRITVVGRPNVGKSSFVNVLLGRERAIVSEIAGTTRDPIDSHYNSFGKEFVLIDTAGLRKKSKVHDNIEFYSVLRTVRSIEDSDVCILMIDATQGFESQDMNIIRLAINRNKGVVIMVNKWDLVAKDTNTAAKMEEEIRQKLRPSDYIPILFSSVVEKKRILQVIDKAIECYENKNKKVPTSQLNDKILPEIEKIPPPAYRGLYIKIKYITQVPASAPVFIFFCNHPDHIPESYERYLEKKIRENFGFDGVPIRLFFRKK
jgi:GTP-binding protein